MSKALHQVNKAPREAEGGDHKQTNENVHDPRNLAVALDKTRQERGPRYQESIKTGRPLDVERAP